MTLHTSYTPSDVPGWWKHDMPDGFAFHCSQQTLSDDEIAEIMRVTESYDGDADPEEADRDADGWGWEDRALAGVSAHG